MMADNQQKRRGRPSNEERAARLNQTGRCPSCTHYDATRTYCGHHLGVIGNPSEGCADWANSALPLAVETNQIAKLTVPPAPRNVAQAVGEAVSEQAGRDIANQLLGQIQMARAFSDFANVVSLTKLQHIKETKQYKTLAGQTVKMENGETANVGTWEGFLQAIGLDRSKIDEDLLNLRVFGESALNNLSRIGAGYRDLRKLRKLESEDRRIVIEELGQRIEEDADDKEAIKEAFSELLETVQKRADKRVAELQSNLDTARREQSASDKVLADKEKKIRELHSALESTQEKPISPDQKIAAWAKQISDISDNAQYASTSSLGAIHILFKRIADEYERSNAAIPRPLQQAMGTAVQRLRAGVEALAEEFQLWGAMDEVINAGSGGDDSWLQGQQQGGLN